MGTILTNPNIKPPYFRTALKLQENLLAYANHCFLKGLL